MANNRMQMYCKGCMELLIIGKYSPDTWGFDPEIGEAMNRFAEKHYDCSRRIAGFDTNSGEGWFGFRTENDGDGLFTHYTSAGDYLSRKAVNLDAPTTDEHRR